MQVYGESGKKLCTIFREEDLLSTGDAGLFDSDLLSTGVSGLYDSNIVWRPPILYGEETSYKLRFLVSINKVGKFRIEFWL